MTPGEIVRDARRRHGLTQQRLAVRAGTTQSAISRIERDDGSPTVETLSGLLHLMGEELVLSSRRAETGNDPSLLRGNLALSPQERIERGAAHARFVLRNRGAARPDEDGDAGRRA